MATDSSVTGLYVGTSGFAYPSWRPGFYPAGTRPADFLGHYAKRFRAVELNTTGYRLPSEDQFARWGAAVPAGFRFAVKLPAYRTRMLGEFSERVRLLGEHLGPVRVAIPSARDEGLIELLLGSLDPGLRLAFDFAHPSWDGIEERLAASGATTVNGRDEGSRFRYLRLREPPYDDDDLRGWAERIKEDLARGLEVYCFVRHEEEPTAPAYAQRLRELVAG